MDTGMENIPGDLRYVKNVFSPSVFSHKRAHTYCFVTLISTVLFLQY